ncbi:ComF family protein, partial [Candidatus Daviesbacteria bacterium]|nr:ComF family protein [Candidatus Daviesbacteria bacterium]
SIGGLTHPFCIRRYGLDGLWSLGIYQDPLKRAIQKIKYRWIKELAGDLVDILIEYWARNPPILLDQIKKSQGKDWVITSIPLHWSRKNWRGFNQAELLAKLLAKKLGLKYQELLKRKINTKTQVGLDSYSRRKNIKGAFSLTKPYTLNANILLIDDVWTTGATLKECAKVLKRARAKSVWALTLAR